MSPLPWRPERRPCREGHPSVPVRAGPGAVAGARAAVARGGGAVRVELGPGPVQGTVRSRRQVVRRCRPAQAVERAEEGRPGAWPGGSRTPSAPTRRRSATWTGRCSDFIKSRKGQRKGRRLGFPKFKKRGRCRDSFRFSTGTMRCAGTTVTLPRLGTIRTHESTRKLARRLEAGSARILSVTVSRTAQRWFVSFTVEVERADAPEPHARPGSAIGIDLGVTTLLTGVDDAGNVVTVPGSETAAGSAAQATARQPGTLPKNAWKREPAQACRPARPHPRSRLPCACRRLAQSHDHSRRPLPDRRRRGSERGRHGPQPQAGACDQRPGVRRGPADARLQDRLARRPANPR